MKKIEPWNPKVICTLKRAASATLPTPAVAPSGFALATYLMTLPGSQGVSMPSFITIGSKLWVLEGYKHTYIHSPLPSPFHYMKCQSINQSINVKFIKRTVPRKKYDQDAYKVIISSACLFHESYWKRKVFKWRLKQDISLMSFRFWGRQLYIAGAL